LQLVCLPVGCLSFIIIISAVTNAPRPTLPASSHRVPPAFYLTLGSLMAGNRILMDFVISSATTETTAKLCVFRAALVFAYFLPFASAQIQDFLLLTFFFGSSKKDEEKTNGKWVWKPRKGGEKWAD